MEGPRLPDARSVRTAATAASLLVVLLFTGVILLGPGNELLVHEVAGLLLLLGILTALGAALRTRRAEPGPVPRLAAALGVLVAVGATGGALALGELSGRLAYLPLAGLIVLAALLAETLRVGHRRTR